MNKKLEWLIIIFMLIILVTMGSRDASADHVAPQQPEVPEAVVPDDSTPTVANMEGIANVLGCVFDPTTCQDKKDPGKTEEGKQ